MRIVNFFFKYFNFEIKCYVFFSNKELTNYIFEDVRKRIDLGLMWIYNNYLKLKEAYRTKKIINSIKDEILENGINKQEFVNRERENLNDIQNYELEYDRTLYTILFSLQKRQDSKDL